MSAWKYEIYDMQTDRLITQDQGYENESDAESMAETIAKSKGLKQYYIRTYPGDSKTDET